MNDSRVWASSPQPLTVRAAGRCLAVSGSVEAVLHGQSLEKWMALLAPYEYQRAGSIRDVAARRAYVAAHVLVRDVAAQLLNLSPSLLTLVQRCETCGADHGPPHWRITLRFLFRSVMPGMSWLRLPVMHPWESTSRICRA